MQQSDYITTLFEGHSDPSKVTIAFTLAVNALNKGHSATIVLMLNAVELGRPEAMADINIGQPFESVADLLDCFLDKGGQLAVCKSCLIHNGFTETDMDPRFPIITGGDVVDLVMAAKGTMQIT